MWCGLIINEVDLGLVMAWTWDFGAQNKFGSTRKEIDQPRVGEAGEFATQSCGDEELKRLCTDSKFQVLPT